MELNRNLTNDVLLADANIKQQLDNGNLVLIDMVPTSNPEYTNLYFIGKVTGLASSNTGISQLAAALLNWGSNEVYMRSIQNASTEVAQQMQKGQALPGTMRVIDSLEPAFEGQTSRIDRNGKQLLSGGKPVYRTTQICTIEEFEQQGHDTLEIDRAPIQKPQSSGQVAGSEVNTSPSSSVNNLLGNQA